MMRAWIVAAAVAALMMGAPAAAQDAETPRPGQYAINTERSEATLTVRRPGGRVQAKIPFAEGSLRVDEAGDVVAAEAVLNAAALTADGDVVEGELRGESGLDVERHPEVSFVSTAVRRNGEALTVEGDLTLKGVTQPVELTGRVQRARPRRLVLVLEGQIDRTAFGVTAGRPLFDRDAHVRLRVVGRRGRR